MTKLKLDIPSTFYEGETRCGHYVEPQMKAAWAVMLDLLSELQRVCDKHGIVFWMDGGTLLGAVRHQGFIPWDDDIDVAMHRKDYERLCAVAAEEFQHPYFFQNEQTDPLSMRGHGQLRHSETTGAAPDELRRKYSFNQGIFIDIFILDNVPDDDGEFKRQKRNVRRYKYSAHRYRNVTVNYSFRTFESFGRNLKYLFWHMLSKFGGFDYNKAYAQFDAEMQRCKDDRSKRVANFALPSITHQCTWPREYFDKIVMTSFEMLKVPIPAEYEKVLDVHYGNWRQMVKGGQTHGGIFFDTENSYTKYTKSK